MSTRTPRSKESTPARLSRSGSKKEQGTPLPVSEKKSAPRSRSRTPKKTPLSTPKVEKVSTPKRTPTSRAVTPKPAEKTPQPKTPISRAVTPKPADKSPAPKTPKLAKKQTPAKASAEKPAERSRSQSKSVTPNKKRMTKQTTIDATKIDSAEFLKGAVAVHEHSTRSAEKSKRRK